MPALPIATVDTARFDISLPCADKQAETGEVVSSAGISDCIESSESSGNDTVPPSPLEGVIPEDHLPDILDVYDTDTFRRVTLPDSHIPLYHVSDAMWNSWEKFLARCPLKFVRGSNSKNYYDMLDHGTIGQLDLRRQRYIGSGNHSYVFLAPVTFLPCTGPTRCGEVAVKLSRLRSLDQNMFSNEIRLYGMFPRELQESTPSSPPVVPQYYGVYEPVYDDYTVGHYKDDDGDEEAASIVRTHVSKMLEMISHILLLEPCGEPIKVETLSTSNKDTIAGLYDRLHNANFFQGSVAPRNILVQPGPLTCPRAERSFDNPSYRIIDFGSGSCYNGFEEKYADERMRKMSEEKERVRLRLGICDDVDPGVGGE